MSFTIKAGTVNKRKNSTYVPTNLNHEYEVVLKESCSDYAPVFILQNPTNRFSYNYIEWDGWYYYIDDVIREKNHMVTIKCRLDPLASARPYILASTQFVAYDTTANTELPDPRISKKTTAIYKQNTGNFQKLGTVSSAGRGTVLLGTVTDNGTMYYALSAADAAAILKNINAVEIPNVVPPTQIGDFATVEEGIDYIANMFSKGCTQFFASGSAANCIISAREIALPLSAFYGASQSIYLGSYDTGKSGIAITGRRVEVDTVSVAIPWTFTDWRRNEPYTEHYFFNEFIGLIKLPAADIIGKTSIYVESYFDMISGDMVSIMSATGDSVITRLGTYTGSLACEYSVGTTATPLSRSLGGVGMIAGAGIGAVALGLGAGAAALAIGTAAINGLNMGMTPIPTSTTGGGGGASLALRSDCYVMEITHDTNVTPDSVSIFMGTPTMAVKSLSGLSGYVECRNASVSAPFSESILQEINNYLNGGVYLE